MEADMLELSEDEKQELERIMRGERAEGKNGSDPEHEEISYELRLSQLGVHLSEHGRLEWATSKPHQLYGALHTTGLWKELARFTSHNCGGRILKLSSKETWSWSIKGRKLDAAADVILPHLQGRMKEMMELYFVCRAEAQEMRTREEPLENIHRFCMSAREEIDVLRREISAIKKEDKRRWRLGGGGSSRSTLTGGEKKARRRAQARRRSARKKMK